MADLRVSTFVVGDAVVLQAQGAADLITEPVLRAALDRALQDSSGGLVVDLSKVVFCDVRGLTTLLHARRDAAACGIAFATAGASPLLVRMWVALHPAGRGVHYTTVAEAIRAVNRRRAANPPPFPSTAGPPRPASAP